jgi:uncharacterized membrane protein
VPGGRGTVGGAAIAAAALAAPRATESNLQLTSPLVWVMIAIGAAGAIVTFAFLVYAIVKFRDPATRRRRYG